MRPFYLTHKNAILNLNHYTAFLYLAYIGSKEKGEINKDTSFFDFLKIFGVFFSEVYKVVGDPDYKSPYLSFADCSSEVKDNLKRLQKCSNTNPKK